MDSGLNVVKVWRGACEGVEALGVGVAIYLVAIVGCGVLGFRGGVIAGGCSIVRERNSCWILFRATTEAVHLDCAIGTLFGRKGPGICGLCVVFPVIGVGNVCGRGILSSCVFSFQLRAHVCVSARVLFFVLWYFSLVVGFRSFF